MKTKLIFAVFFAAAVFSQNAQAYGAVWEYGGNYGLGKGVGAVANYETQAEADHAAIKDCEKKRPGYAARSKWGNCRVEERFQDVCASFMRSIIKGIWIDHRKGGKFIEEDHSAMVFYDIANWTGDLRSNQIRRQYPTRRKFEEFIKHGSVNRCNEYNNKAHWGENNDRTTAYRGRVNPKYAKKHDNNPDMQFFQYRLSCGPQKETGMVCDTVGFEINLP
ncbi:MAG: DUF4189 domain-containing protein [Betaproteobacteria bacterium]|nr:DUF4189 domain-containing protein [Betaproteobacteria bacterium]